MNVNPVHDRLVWHASIEPGMQIVLNKLIVIEVRIRWMDAIYFFDLSRRELFIWIQTTVLSSPWRRRTSWIPAIQPELMGRIEKRGIAISDLASPGKDLAWSNPLSRTSLHSQSNSTARRVQQAQCPNNPPTIRTLTVRSCHSDFIIRDQINGRCCRRYQCRAQSRPRGLIRATALTTLRV